MRTQKHKHTARRNTNPGHDLVSVQHISVPVGCCVDRYRRGRGGAGGLDGGGCSWRRGGTLWEVGGEEAERLALVGGQGGAIALKVAWDAAAGGT